jgi:hypothetical protein
VVVREAAPFQATPLGWTVCDIRQTKRSHKFSTRSSVRTAHLYSEDPPVSRRCSLEVRHRDGHVVEAARLHNERSPADERPKLHCDAYFLSATFGSDLHGELRSVRASRCLETAHKTRCAHGAPVEGPWRLQLLS